jgi:hypothetical protein
MGRSPEAIIEDLKAFDPIETGWEPLGSLIDELMASQAPQKGIDALLQIFERSPGALTAGGYFFPAMHALESLKGFEAHLVQSVKRMPSVLSVTMVNALLNATKPGDKLPLLKLLEEANNLPTTMRTVREKIEATLQRHQPSVKRKRRKPLK